MIKPALELWIKGNLRKTILLNRSVTRIGRHDDNDVVLRNIGVSRHHAKIVDDGGVFTVHDLQSANGIIVNREPAEHAALAVGDEILIGKFTLRFVTVDSSRTDLAPGGYVLGEDTPAGPTFEVRGAMARKIRERYQPRSGVKPAAPDADQPVVVATLADDVDLGAAAAGRVEYALRAMRDDEWLFEKALEPGEFLIGRSADNHIILAGANVSRRHAMLTVDDRGFIIEDLGSRNGIRVNGEAVERRGLTLGDEVTVGDFRLMLVQHDLIGQHAVLDAEDLAAADAGPETGDAAAATAHGGGGAPGFEIEHELRWQDPEPEEDGGDAGDTDTPIEAEIVSPEHAADQGGEVAFAYPLEDAEVTIQLSGWTTTHAFQPDSLRRATGSGAHEDRITVRVQLADGIRRFTFAVDDMEAEDED